METTIRTCPYCAEEIRPEAIKCRHCGSRLVSLDPTHWHRAHSERRVAGVSAAVAHGLAVPVDGVRLAFVALTFLRALGPVTYGLLWAIIPPRPGEPSVAERALEHAKRAVQPLVAWLRDIRSPHAGGPLA